MKKLADFFRSRKHLAITPLFLLFILGFIFVEKKITPDKDFFVCYVPVLDDLIPFCEWFVLPYIMWYPYMAAVCLYLGLQKDGMEYIRAFTFIFGGMMLCLFICLLFPNGQNLRPETFPRENFLTFIVSSLYHADTNTNVLPSMHVYASMATHSAIMKSRFPLFRKPCVRRISLFLCILICISTVFIKQHSLLDGFAAIILFIPLYYFNYYPYTKFLKKRLCRHRSL